MDAGLIDVHISPDDFALCTQDSFLASFAPNDLSTDSASTSQLTSGGGPLGYSQSCPYAPVLGNPPPHEFQTTPTAEGCSFFDECSGLYSQPLTQFPFQNTSIGNTLPAISRDPGYNDLTESYDPTSTASFTKYCLVASRVQNRIPHTRRDFLAMPSACQQSAMSRRCVSLHLDASNQLMISEMDRSLPSDTFHVSKSVPTLSSQPQQMEHPTLRCGAGLLEPSLTIGSALWSEPIVKEEIASQRASPQRRSEESFGTAPKNRWKPNPRQLYFLEQHFRTGYTKATPELFRAVQEAGPVTELQVSVWLKNRLARYKRHPNKLNEPRSEESTNIDSDIVDATMIGNKRERQEEDPIDDFGYVKSAVMDELSMILESVDSRDMTGLARAIRDANRICCYGVSREGLALKAFAINLHNLGFKAYFVGDTNTPALTNGDLFLVAAGPSYYSTVNALSLEAMRSGARVIAFTAHKTAPLPYVDCVIRIASQTLPPSMPVMNRKLGGLHAEMVSSLPEGRSSVLQMGASFEVALSLVLESVCIMLRKKLHISMKDLAVRGNNLY